MNGRNLLVLALLALAAWGAWSSWVPGAGGRLEAMAIDADAGRIELDGVVYTAHFGERVGHAGDVRLIQTVHHEPAPIITHELVLTTGEFSDREFTKIEPHRPGSVRIEAPRMPEGTLTMVHAIPANAQVVQALDGLAEGAAAEVRGREIVEGKIENSNGGWLRLRQAGHAIVLVDAVTVR